jgi:hypothetical protein
MHRDALIAAGAELIRFARSCGLIRGEWVAIDGSNFRAVASIDSTRERLALQRYIDNIEKADEEQQASIDPSAVQTALEKLKQHPEREAGFMLVRQTALPALGKGAEDRPIYDKREGRDRWHRSCFQGAVQEQALSRTSGRLFVNGKRSMQRRSSRLPSR